MGRVAALLEAETYSDFVDLNCGCPIDLLCNQGCGAAMMQRPNRLAHAYTCSYIHMLIYTYAYIYICFYVHTYMCILMILIHSNGPIG